MPPAVVSPAKVVSSSLPSAPHPLGMHRSISRCTDFCHSCRFPILTCLQHMYNTVGGNAPPVGAFLAPYGSPGASGVCGVVRPLAYISLPPLPRVWSSLMSLSAPLVPVQCVLTIAKPSKINPCHVFKRHFPIGSPQCNTAAVLGHNNLQ